MAKKEHFNKIKGTKEMGDSEYEDLLNALEEMYQRIEKLEEDALSQ